MKDYPISRALTSKELGKAFYIPSGAVLGASAAYYPTIKHIYKIKNPKVRAALTAAVALGGASGGGVAGNFLAKKIVREAREDYINSIKNKPRNVDPTNLAAKYVLTGGLVGAGIAGSALRAKSNKPYIDIIQKHLPKSTYRDVRAALYSKGSLMGAKAGLYGIPVAYLMAKYIESKKKPGAIKGKIYNRALKARRSRDKGLYSFERE